MTRHPVETGRLILGLLLTGSGLAYVLDARGPVSLPSPLLLLLVPASLAAAALTGLLAYVVRRARGRRRSVPRGRAGPPPARTR